MSDSNIPKYQLTKELAKDSQRLNPGAIIEIIQIYLKDIKFTNKLSANSSIKDVYYFHNTDLFGDIVISWGGKSFDPDVTQRTAIDVHPLPFELTGVDKQSTQLPRPILRISNFQQYLSLLLMELEDLRSAKVIRHKTLVKYLNNRRVRYADEIYFINKKSKETKDVIEFELVSSLELEGVTLPRRQIIGSYCPFIYRGSSCGYSSFPICDSNGKFFEASKAETSKSETSYGFPDWEINDGHDKGEWQYSNTYQVRDYVFVEHREIKIYFICIQSISNGSKVDIFDQRYWKADTCNKKLDDCKNRWGNQASLPYGGFPATAQYTFD